MYRTSHPPARARRSRRGFTLVELVTAMLLITVALMGAAALIATSLRFQRGAASREEMITVAEAKLDHFRALQLAPKNSDPWKQLNVGGSLVSDQPDYSAEVKSGGRRYRLRWQITNSTAGTRQVVLRVEPKALGAYVTPKVDFRTLVFVQ
jgi:prepilin-type N-terminal cleavage/methylation domain-containing protein